MPELPDVQVYRQTIDATSLHKTITTLHVSADRLLRNVSDRTLRRHLKDRELEGTRRHGKWLFVESEDGWLLLHFGMTGEPIYRETGDPPDYAKLALDFADGGTLHIVSRRKLGWIGWIDDPDAFIEEEELGPDPLATEGFDVALFRDRLDGRRGTIKGTLMNQEVIAGLGNVYVDEILFQAGLHPEAKTDGLETETTGRLHRAMHRVIRKAIEVRVDPDEMPRRWLLPRREPEVDCPRCDGRIRRIDVSGRTTYYCPSHQDRRT